MNIVWKYTVVAMALPGLLFSCKNTETGIDASGVFEAEEIMIPAEASGVIEEFNLEEGADIKLGQVLGYIDSTQLYLKKQQLLAQLRTIDSRLPQIAIQTASFKKQRDVVESQIQTLEKEKTRIQNLIKVDAATPKQLDDISGQLDALNKQLVVIDQQYLGQKSVLSTQSNGLSSEKSPILVQIEQVNDQLEKAIIKSPLTGTVLTKYAYAKEMALPGKTLFKAADLGSLIFRAYITGDQLASIKLNQKVTVLTDSTSDAYKSHAGVVTWISNKAEFTPKTIQTKDERANRVYAIKVLVKNEGDIKIGMYGEMKFN